MKFSEIVSLVASGEIQIGHVALKSIQVLWSGCKTATEYRLMGGLWKPVRVVNMPPL